MQDNQTNKFINLSISTRYGKILDNQFVFAVSAINQKGLFDVLPEHENFISLIKDRIIVHKSNSEQQEVKINTGVLRAANNKVEIFLELK